jgi:hypothetical protein
MMQRMPASLAALDQQPSWHTVDQLLDASIHKQLALAAERSPMSCIAA